MRDALVIRGEERNSRRKRTRMDASEDRKRQEEMEIFWGVRLGECIRGRAPYNPDDASLVFSPP